MNEPVKFCAILTMRYTNKSLMQSAHDYIDEHMPPPPQGLVAIRSFHIAPDRGMSICYFDTNFAFFEAFFDPKIAHLGPILESLRNLFEEKVRKL